MSLPNEPPQIDRSFARIADGLMHLRHAGQSSAEPPLWMMHAAPASSRSLEPLLASLAGRRRVHAPDTPGYGDSAALAVADPELTDYAAAMLQRVRRVVLDGLLVLDDAERAEFLAHYAPPVQPDAAGLQFAWAVNYIRDQAWFFPHFRRDAAHNLGQGAMSAEVLHYLVTELLKAVGTYHLGYRAVFRHRVIERVAALSQPTLLTADASDPTRAGLRALAAACPRLHCDLLDASADPARTPGKAQRIDAFLLSPPAAPGSRT